MAKYSNIINGLNLFLSIEGDSHNTGAEHDVLYAGDVNTAEKLTEDQKKQLEEWGWFIDDETGSYKVFV